MPRVDTYQHLEKSQPLEIHLPMDDLARTLVTLNYGVHRMLSSLVRELRIARAKQVEQLQVKYPGEVYPPSALADGLEKLLNDGHVD